MKLLRRVARLGAAPVPCVRDSWPIGIAWTEGTVRAPREPSEGEHVAVDVFVLQETSEVTRWRIEERICADSADWGLVFGADGVRVGRVVAVKGHMIDVAYDRPVPPELASGRARLVRAAGEK